MADGMGTEEPFDGQTPDPQRSPRVRERKLRWGFSTGTAAAAAAKGALLALLGVDCPGSVAVTLPGGGHIEIPLARHERRPDDAECIVIKDGGDDPDATHRAKIGARVRWVEPFPDDDSRSVQGPHHEEPLEAAGVRLAGDQGVGLVTKPGLPVGIGEPAINPVPRRMIRRAVLEVMEEQRPPGFPSERAVEVEVFVHRGEEIAGKTLNPRLGIVGGISILGTTGLVKPFSHGAYRATIYSALQVARAAGLDRVVLTTGGKSEKFSQSAFPELPPEAFVQMGDFVAFSVRRAIRLGFRELIVSCFFGKAVKIAQGFTVTHASRGEIDFDRLAEWLRVGMGSDTPLRSVQSANTAREVLEILRGMNQLEMVAEVGRRTLLALLHLAGEGSSLEVLIYDFHGPLLWRGRSGEGGRP